MQNAAGFFRLERREKNSVLYLAREGMQAITLRRDATRQQVRDALGHLPSGTPDRRRIAIARIREAGLTG